MRSIRARLKVLVILAVTFGALGAGPMVGEAAASHFRGGDVSWVETGANTADFQLTVAYRCGFFFATNCAGVSVGQTFLSDRLQFGDGALSGNQMRVEAINAAEDFFIAKLLETGSTTDTTVSHTYTGAGPFTAFMFNCCNLSTLENAADSSYRLETDVSFATDDESPKTSVPPVVNVGASGVQTFNVQATDAGGETLRYRLATSEEASGGAGVAVNPPNYSINASTGQVSFNTTGLPEGLYYSSIIVEALNGAGTVISATQVTFLIRVSSTVTNRPPVFNPPTPADGTEFTVAPGQNLTINLNATDPDTGQIVTLVSSALPPGATFNQTPGNPATGTFSFTPTAAQLGQDFVVNFTAQDDQSPPASVFRSYTIRVRSGGPTGRMVGKGSVTGTGGSASYSYILRCNPAANTNAPFEVRFNGQRFRLTSTSSVACTDDPAVATPAAGFDTMTGTGSGTLTTGGPGTVQFKFVDGGLGGANDRVELTVRNAANAVVFQGTAAPPGKFPGSDQATGNNVAQTTS